MIDSREGRLLHTGREIMFWAVFDFSKIIGVQRPRSPLRTCTVCHEWSSEALGFLFFWLSVGALLGAENVGVHPRGGRLDCNQAGGGVSNSQSPH